MARLLEVELARREKELANACAAANAESRLAEEIEEWQAFDDARPPARAAGRVTKGKK